MPTEPPWPVEVLVQLNAVLALLQKQVELDPRDPVIPGITAHVEAAIAAVEPLAKRSAAT